MQGKERDVRIKDGFVLSRGDDAEDIAQELVKSYDVDLETAQRDVASFVATAQKAGFLA